jgi:hypothetical protein
MVHGCKAVFFSGWRLIKYLGGLAEFFFRPAVGGYCGVLGV